MISFPFDNESAQVQDRSVSSDVLADMLSLLTGRKNGLDASVKNSFQVLSKGGMNISINPGACMINGRLAIEKDVVTKVLTSEPTAINIFVTARLNKVTRDIQFYLLKNVEYVRDTDIWDLTLAKISIPANAISITQARITDLRLDNKYCGMFPFFGKLDTTNFYNQIQSDLANFKQQSATDYEQYTKSAVAMYKELEKLISESETGLKDMSYSEYTKLLSWFSEYKTGLVVKYNQLEEDIRGILTKEAETNLLMMIKDLQASQVNGLVGELVLDGKVDVSNYPTYQLFETMGGAGTQGAGSAGAGYFSNKTIPVEVEATSHNTLKVYASPQYASENSTIVQNSSSNWTILNEQTNKFLSFNIKN